MNREEVTCQNCSEEFYVETSSLITYCVCCGEPLKDLDQQDFDVGDDWLYDMDVQR